jgi:hypothetical protein
MADPPRRPADREIAAGVAADRSNVRAMISSEVQRTLVKSPPELWAELSDPAALARHLGELGEIRIVRVDPESTVEWASENTTGTVSIKPSGWGTNVKLTVTRELAGATSAASSQPQPGESEPVETPAPGPVTDEPAAAVEPEAEATVEPEAEAAVDPEPEAAVDREPEAVESSVAVEPKSKQRRGFFARLFWRLRAPAAADLPRSWAPGPTDASAPELPPEPSDAFAAVRDVLAPESFAASHPYAALPPTPSVAEPSVDISVMPGPQEPAGEAQNEPVVSDISAELMAAEDMAAEEVAAVLTAVLDCLGAAHHRPFSRA